MNPDTLRSWAYAADLTKRELQVFELFLRYGELTKAQVEDHLYGHREDGGPICARRNVDVFMCHIREKLAGRIRIVPSKKFRMEVIGAVVQPAPGRPD